MGESKVRQSTIRISTFLFNCLKSKTKPSLTFTLILNRLLGPKIIGRRLFDKVAGCSDYMFNRPNPLMQVRFLPSSMI